MKIQKYAPARWSRRGMVTSLIAYGALALTLSACTPTEPTPDPEFTRAWDLCVWAHPATDEYTSGTLTAAEACQEWLDNTDEQTFTATWTFDYAADFKLAYGN